MPKALLITGATGKQGSAVVDALLAQGSKDTILAVTRDPESASAKRLVHKSPTIKLVKGNLDDVPAVFEAAKKMAKGEQIWGVYSVQLAMGKGATSERETKQGIALVDEALKNGVQHFVYSSVDRGGDEVSWNNPTDVPHFVTKHNIEHHLRNSAGSKMGWTILRPVCFMDNLEPAYPTKVFLAALKSSMKDKPLQWVATADIGWFAAQALSKPQEYNHKAIGLAGDELTFDQLSKAFKNTTGQPAGTSFSFLGSTLMYLMPEMGKMLTWFATEGYGADIKALRSKHPELLDLESWITQKSRFETKADK
ncbi:hypothetical protein IWX90DRAFT_442379 [Phyllosticta citrichinensis]|uniref:NmrA-like domain-containing protein n=1 Tax=Phyllosticta citrichinensis TaxID=1130410 RepID=A0ABR1XJL2_9PEZI